MYTYTYKSIDAANIHRNTVQLACNTGTHVNYLTVECDTRSLTNVIGLMFTFPVVVKVDSEGNVEINGRNFGKFKRLSLKSK